MRALWIVACVALLAASCDSGSTSAGDGVEPTEIDNVWTFQHDSLGGDAALHGGVAEIRNNCLYVDDAVVVWHESQIGQAEDLITDIKAGGRPDVLLGGGGISLDEGDTPIPSLITDLCPTRVVWYSSP